VHFELVDLVDFWGNADLAISVVALAARWRPAGIVERLSRLSKQNLQGFFRHFLQHLRQAV